MKACPPTVRQMEQAGDGQRQLRQRVSRDTAPGDTQKTTTARGGKGLRRESTAMQTRSLRRKGRHEDAGTQAEA